MLKRCDRVITSLSSVTNEEFYIDRNRANSHLLRTDRAIVTSTLCSPPDLVIEPTLYFSLNKKEIKTAKWPITVNTRVIISH